MVKTNLPSKGMFLLLITVYFAVISLVYLIKGANIGTSLTSFLYLTTFILGAWTVFLDLQQFGIKHPQGKAFLLFFIGFCFAGMGEAVWFFQQTFRWFGSSTIISSSLYFIGYSSALMGFVSEILSLKIDWANKYKLVSKIIIISTIIVGAIVYKLEINPLIQSDLDNSIKLLTLANGLGDLVNIALGAMVLRIAFEYKGGLLFQPWLSIFIAQSIILVADVLYVILHISYFTNVFPYSLINLLFFAANLVIAYGFYGIYSALNETQENILNLKDHQN